MAGAGLLASLLFLSAPGCLAAFLRFVRRGRWLLLALWLVFAYGKPGEALFDSECAPTIEGMVEANAHAVRLLLLFACVAWLFCRLTMSQLLLAIWCLLQPLARLGMDVERLVVRLSLVLENLDTGLQLSDWRRILLSAEEPMVPTTIEISIPVWSFLDSLLVFLALACTLWIVLN